MHSISNKGPYNFHSMIFYAYGFSICFQQMSQTFNIVTKNIKKGNANALHGTNDFFRKYFPAIKDTKDHPSLRFQIYKLFNSLKQVWKTRHVANTQADLVINNN